ncbi:hypothetical protein [Actinomadura sp. HBU206391]|uniref:hypothetical protein n=1 Tax=Actinomadura sp. HBU206391 TaxID=2731692 RepID=UPI00164FA493|nr:hypothetical protein [Actinomadura sp. HBU206391]MBC6457818.1 hypothetical protein [Actinomadura sp. HBU206391]
MELRLASHAFSISDFVIYVADADADAIPESAQIAEVTPDPELLTRIRADRPGLVIAVAAPTPVIAYACAEAGAALLVGDHLTAVAAVTGTGLVCSEPAHAISQGVRADGLLVDVKSVADAEEVVRTGHTVLVTPASTPSGDLSTPATGGRNAAPAAMTADPAVLATAAVYGWVGAKVFRVPAQDVAVTREALDMIASIKGKRPPTVSRRGLV